MNHDYQKRYFEYLAKLVLEIYLPHQYKDLVLSDRPDLRMGDDYGVEVTRALYLNDAKATGIFRFLKDRHIDSVDKRHLDSMERLGIEFLLSDDGVIRGYAPNEGTWINDEELKREYIKKVEKYKNNPLLISTVDLFIYSPMYDWLEKDIIQEFMQWIDEIKGCPFRRIIVFEFSYLYVYDVETKTFETIAVDTVSPKTLKALCTKAREYAFGE